MTITVRAPVRIDFAGGWSDVPTFAGEHGGQVVNATISRYAEVEGRLLAGQIRLISEDLGETFECPVDETCRYDGHLDLHKAALKMTGVEHGVELVSRVQVPPGSGLGASGSLDVALVTCLLEVRGDHSRSAEEVAELAFQLEAVELGLTGGRQDQYAAALGGFLHLEFSGDGVSVNRLAISDDHTRELESSLVIGYTGQTHFSSGTHDRVWQAYREGNRDVVDAIHTMKQLVTPLAKALVAGDWKEVARLVDANWLEQQRLHESIATDGTRAAEAAARRAGVWGMKAAGAGAGGCMVFIGPPERREAIAEAVNQAGGTVLDFRFESRGVRVVT
jgi:D-glycero-alpha-D-manno-heptose-7-phosphate kinase